MNTLDVTEWVDWERKVSKKMYQRKNEVSEKKKESFKNEQKQMKSFCENGFLSSVMREKERERVDEDE